MPGNRLKATKAYFMQKVKQLVPLHVIRSMTWHIKFRDKDLWGKFKPDGFEELMILMTLFKDIKVKSYSWLHGKINKELKMAKKSIEHNTKVVCKKLYAWSKTVLTPYTKVQLEHLAKQCHCPEPTQNVSLWVDSTDFWITYKKQDPDRKKTRSYKEKHAARRWVTLCDVEGVTQWVSHPYHPTVYDGDILIHNAQVIEKIFPKVTIIGDNHFQ
jgi:hypothetical protein